MLLAHLCVNGTGHADTADIVTRALQSNPLHPVAHCHLGLWRLQQQQPAPAIDCYRQALQIEPAHAQAHFNLALCLLLTGDFEAGWPAFEWRWQTVQYRRAQRQFTQPLWLGQTPLAGKTILLHAEQGLGDTLQFCRYASVLARRGARVLLQVQPVLQPLLRSLDGVAQVLATSAALPSFDYHCPLMSLPLALRTRLGDVPASPGYLSATVPDDLARWQRQLGPKAQARIGLVWADNPGHGNDARR